MSNSFGVPTLKEFVDAMSVGWPIALAISIGSSFVLLAHHFQVTYVAGLPQWLLALVFILAVFSAGVWIAELVRAAGRGVKFITQKAAMRKTRRRRLEWLRSLPEHEHNVMAFMFTRNTQAFPAMHGHERLVSLIQKGLITVQPGTHSVLDWPHFIPDYVWKEMERNRERFYDQSIMRGRSPLARF